METIKNKVMTTYNPVKKNIMPITRKMGINNSQLIRMGVNNKQIKKRLGA